MGYNSRQCLITMIEKWRESVDEGGSFSALLTDLSKVFDCLPHELLIAKLHAYSFDMKSQNSYMIICPIEDKDKSRWDT